MHLIPSESLAVRQLSSLAVRQLSRASSTSRRGRAQPASSSSPMERRAGGSLDQDDAGVCRGPRRARPLCVDAGLLRQDGNETRRRSRGRNWREAGRLDVGARRQRRLRQDRSRSRRNAYRHAGIFARGISLSSCPRAAKPKALVEYFAPLFEGIGAAGTVPVAQIHHGTNDFGPTAFTNADAIAGILKMKGRTSRSSNTRTPHMASRARLRPTRRPPWSRKPRPSNSSRLACSRLIGGLT